MLVFQTEGRAVADVDIRGVFTVLKENGYDGYITLETLAGGKEDLRFSVNHVKKEWETA